MAFNDLPAAIQSVIQQGFLEREFQDALRAKLGFRMIADKEPFSGNIGETITKTRTGLLAAVTTPMAPAQVQDITSGLALSNYGVEQYTLGINQYANPMMLNVATSRVAIANLYLNNAKTLGENAMRSVDTLARNCLFDNYMGGNTRVTVTLGGAGTTVQVDDVRGFFNTLNTQGQVVPVSAANPLLVVVGSNSYQLIGVTADGTAPILNPWMNGLAFSGTGANTSTAPGGFSGVLTFSTNVTVADATILNAVVAATAPLIIRPSLASTNVQAATTAAISSANDVNNGKLTMQMVLDGKAALSSNAVPPSERTGNYILYCDPTQMTGLYQDQAFQRFFVGKPDSKEYRQGLIAELLGVDVVETNQSAVQTSLFNTVGGNVRRALLCGQGALIEGEFTGDAYGAAAAVDDADGMITVVDGIAHVTREPLDVLKQVVTQTWAYIGGFCAPTDALTNPNTIPTATNAAYKRALILESL